MISAGEFLLKGSIRQSEINDLKNKVNFSKVYKVRRLSVPTLYETVSLTFRNSKHFELHDNHNLIRAIEPILRIANEIINYLANEGKIIKHTIFELLIEFRGQKFNIKFKGDFKFLAKMIRHAEDHLQNIKELNAATKILVELLSNKEIRMIFK